MDAHRDIGGEVPEEEWQRVLKYAGALSHWQWLSDGMITGEDVYMDTAMEVFCRCWRLHDPAKGTSRFSTFFWKCVRQELRHVRSRVFTLKKREAVGAEALYPSSRTVAFDDSPILWAQVLALLPNPRHRAFLLRLLSGERAVDIARDEGRTEGAMVSRLRLIARTVAEAKG